MAAATFRVESAARVRTRELGGIEGRGDGVHLDANSNNKPPEPGHELGHVGALAGSLVAGALSDGVGRRRTMLLAGALFSRRRRAMDGARCGYPCSPPPMTTARTTASQRVMAASAASRSFTVASIKKSPLCPRACVVISGTSDR
jgi:hypothetical protein